MKTAKVVILSAVILQILLGGCAIKDNSQKDILLGFWKFKTDDKIEFAKKNYDDSKWDSIKTDRSWEEQSYQNYDGYAWYRKNVFIPTSLQQASDKNDSLKIFFGKIDDYDQVYLNGSILGENGKNLRKGTLVDTSFKSRGGNGLDRQYTLSVNDNRILWDKMNLIAVRVFDKKGRGGIYSNMDAFIGMKGFEDSISLSNKNFYAVDSKGKVDTTVFIKNLSTLNLNGKLLIVAENIITTEVIYKTSLPVDLNIGENKTIPVSLPVCTDPIKVSFRYEDKKSRTAVYYFTVPYSLIHN